MYTGTSTWRLGRRGCSVTSKGNEIFREYVVYIRSTTVMPTLSETLVSVSILPVHFLSRVFFSSSLNHKPNQSALITITEAI